MTRDDYLLIGWISLLFLVALSLELYVFHFEAFLYFLATFPSRNIGGVFDINLLDSYELAYKIIPYKLPVFFSQFALVVSLFVYTKVVRRRFNLIVIKVIYWVTFLLIIFFAFLTLLIPIIPYGGMVG